MSFSNLRHLLIAAAIPLAALTSACSTFSSDVGLSVVGVNYTESEYSMIVRDPVDKKNYGVTGELTPYSAGGQMCCFSLPSKWHPDLTVRVSSLRAVIENGKYVRDAITVSTVPVPRYEPGQSGTFWILQFDDRVEVINSLYAPGHPQWEGSVKGWPVPSLAYRKKLWSVHLKTAQMYVNSYQSLLEELKNDPDQAAQDNWAASMKRAPNELAGFTGPDDPEYRTYLLNSLNEGLARSNRRVADMKAKEPK